MTDVKSDGQPSIGALFALTLLFVAVLNTFGWIVGDLRPVGQSSAAASIYLGLISAIANCVLAILAFAALASSAVLGNRLVSVVILQKTSPRIRGPSL